MNIWDEIRSGYRNGTIITRLLYINVGLFVVQSAILLVYALAADKEIFLRLLDYLYFPSTMYQFVHQPWSIITYQFLHDPVEILHILFNMLFLYFFGRILVEFFNPRNIVPLYLTGGIAGALTFMLIYNISPAFSNIPTSNLVGASASILALVVAAATLVPNYTVFLVLIGPVKLKWIAVAVIVLDMVSITAGENAGGHLAHLGGALTGFLYIKSYQKGYNWFTPVFALGDKIKNTFAKKPRVAYVNENREQKKKKDSSEDRQKKTDAILDKIAKSGYESLSRAEKEFLFRISKEDDA